MAAVAGHQGGQPLPDAALGEAVDVQREVGVAVDVDEAGADGPAGRVDGACGLDPGRIADEGDPAAIDDEIGFAGRGAGAVDQAAVADDEVGHVRLRRSRRGG